MLLTLLTTHLCDQERVVGTFATRERCVCAWQNLLQKVFQTAEELRGWERGGLTNFPNAQWPLSVTTRRNTGSREYILCTDRRINICNGLLLMVRLVREHQTAHVHALPLICPAFPNAHSFLRMPTPQAGSSCGFAPSTWPTYEQDSEVDSCPSTKIRDW